MIERVVVIHDTVLTPLHDTLNLVMKDVAHDYSSAVSTLMVLVFLSFCVYRLTK